MAEKEIGTITHWFDNINVAVVSLKGALKKGDEVIIRRNDEEFEETIDSIEIDHVQVEKAGKGDDAAIKLSQKAKEGAVVYKE